VSRAQNAPAKNSHQAKGLKLNINTLRTFSAIFGSLSLAAFVAHANPVTVNEEVGVIGGKTVQVHSSTLGTVTFGADLDVIDVNGVPTDAFCIDPWHYAHSGVSELYNEVPLEDAPNPPGPMGGTAADEVEQLWAEFFSPGVAAATSHLKNGLPLAALQVAIWEVVSAGTGGGNFTFIGPSAVGTAAAADLAWLAANPFAPRADLTGLVPLAGGQAYVIPAVPDGGTTVALLGVGLLGLVALRRRLKAA
jgi:hypothetical protein